MMRRALGRSLTALRPLPPSLFPCFEEAPRKVHRYGHVAYQRAYYSVPPEHFGRDVWVRAEARLVRIFNQRFEPIAVHVRAEPGRFATDDAHLHAHKRVIIERGADYMLERCRLLGANSGAWAEGLMGQRGREAMRTLQGLLALAREHPVIELERACGRAVHLGLWRLRAVRRLAACHFIRAKHDVLFIGPPGTGKTHLAQAIGFEAIKQGFTVGYRSIFDLVRDFLAEDALQQRDRVLQAYLKSDLLIIDDMGLRALPKHSGEYLLEVIMRRYETARSSSSRPAGATSSARCGTANATWT